MKTQLSIVVLLTLALTAFLVGAVSAQGNEPITLNLNLDADPFTLG